MKYGEHFKKQMKDPVFLKALAQEKLITDIQEEICKMMEEKKVSRTDLAKRMGKTRGFITQILNSGRNLTLRTVADVFTALGTKAEVAVKAKEREVKPKKEEKQTFVQILHYKPAPETVLSVMGKSGYKDTLPHLSKCDYPSAYGLANEFDSETKYNLWGQHEEKGKVAAQV